MCQSVSTPRVCDEGDAPARAAGSSEQGALSHGAGEGVKLGGLVLWALRACLQSVRISRFEEEGRCSGLAVSCRRQPAGRWGRKVKTATLVGGPAAGSAE